MRGIGFCGSIGTVGKSSAAGMQLSLSFAYILVTMVVETNHYRLASRHHGTAAPDFHRRNIRAACCRLQIPTSGESLGRDVGPTDLFDLCATAQRRSHLVQRAFRSVNRVPLAPVR